MFHSIVLLQAMERAGVKNFIFSSSCTVYGEPEKVPLDEDHPVGNVSEFPMEGLNFRWRR